MNSRIHYAIECDDVFTMAFQTEDEARRIAAEFSKHNPEALYNVAKVTVITEIVAIFGPKHS
jgi:hypothetical protein